MSLDTWIAAGSTLIAVGALLYSVMRDRKKDSDAGVESIQKDVSSLSARMSTIEGAGLPARVTAIEREQHDHHGQISAAVTELRGVVRTIEDIRRDLRGE